MTRRLPGHAAVLLIAAVMAACSAAPAASGKKDSAADKAAIPLPRALDPRAIEDPYPSTYRPLPAQATAILHATVLTGTGEQIEDGVVIMEEGRIVAVGDAPTTVPSGARVVDARGK